MSLVQKKKINTKIIGTAYLNISKGKSTTKEKYQKYQFEKNKSIKKFNKLNFTLFP